MDKYRQTGPVLESEKDVDELKHDVSLYSEAGNLLQSHAYCGPMPSAFSHHFAKELVHQVARVSQCKGDSIKMCFHCRKGCEGLLFHLHLSAQIFSIGFTVV